MRISSRAARQGTETLAPNDVVAFDTLYADNCAGCHGAGGRAGVAISLADPVYLALVTMTRMRIVIANGVRGTSMPAFAQSAGGTLTDTQIDVITVRSDRDGAVQASRRGHPPSYAPDHWATRLEGRRRSRRSCESCHGRTVAATRRAARSRTIRSSRW
jgi:mono/diheme cytochrome c family protein